MLKLTNEIKVIVITAVITIFFVTPLSIVITNKINGPSPGIVINSISFAKDNQKKIVISDDLLYDIKSLILNEDIYKYSDYKSIYNLYTHIQYNKKELDLSVNQSRSWLNTLKEDSISTESLENSPFINFQTMRDVTMLMLNDDKIVKSIPVSTSAFKNSKENNIPFFVQNGYVGFRLKSHDILLTNMRRLTVNQNINTESLLLSYVYGNKKNIEYFTTMFINNSPSYILKYKELADEIEKILLENTDLEAVITLYNNGHSPVIFTPDFVLRINHNKYEKTPFLLKVIKDEKGDPNTTGRIMKEAMNDYLKKMFESFDTSDGGLLRLVDKIYPPENELFPEIISSSQISLQPGETRTIVLRGNNELINNNDLYMSYQSDLLNCVIAGLSTNGKIFKSNEALFSESNKSLHNESFTNGRW